MAFTSVPYLVAASSQNELWRFSGFLIGVDDGNAYLARMQQGAHGAWRFTLPYSSEQQQGVFLYTFYLLLGKLAGTSHTAQVAVFHLARLVCGVGMILASYAFLAQFLPRIGQRRLALILVCMGGGLGWLIVLAGQPGWLGSLPVDFISPEAFSFLILFSLPHLALARGLFLLALVAYLRGRAWSAGLFLFAAGLMQPLLPLIAWLIVGLDTILGGFTSSAGRTWRPGLLRLTAVVALSAPAVAYAAAVILLDPLLSQWNAQNVLPSPHKLHYVAAYGLLAVPAVAGWRALRLRQPRLAWFAAGWLLLVPILLVAPVPVQRRLVDGAQLPLTALAVAGLTFTTYRWRKWAVAVVAALIIPTTLVIWLGALGAARAPGEPIFHRADKLAAFNWLASEARPGNVVLGAFQTGNALPAFAAVASYVGHGPETILLADKLPRVARFYAADSSDADRLALLSDGRISYVIFGPNETALGGFDPTTADYLDWRFTEGEYHVYEVLQP